MPQKDPFNTYTMAEIFLRQGYSKRAKKILKSLKNLPSSHKDKIEKKINILQKLLNNLSQHQKAIDSNKDIS